MSTQTKTQLSKTQRNKTNPVAGIIARTSNPCGFRHMRLRKYPIMKQAIMKLQIEIPNLILIGRYVRFNRKASFELFLKTCNHPTSTNPKCFRQDGRREPQHGHGMGLPAPILHHFPSLIKEQMEHCYSYFSSGCYVSRFGQ